MDPNEKNKAGTAAGAQGAAGALDPELLGTIVAGQVKEAIGPIVDLVKQQGDALAKLGERLEQAPAPKADEGKTGESDGGQESDPLATANERIAKLEKLLEERVTPIEAERRQAQLRERLLAKRPGLADRPKSVAGVIARVPADAEDLDAAIDAAIAAEAEILAENGHNVDRFAEDYKAQGGDAGGGDADETKQQAQDALTQLESRHTRS